MKYLLTEADEFTHPPTAEPHFNESVYINGFDFSTGIGGWMRIGNRPNEGRAELAVCLYLPDGSIACEFQRPPIADNSKFDAGQLKYEVLEPFSSIEMRYEGELVIAANPSAFRNAKKLFAEAPRKSATISWRAQHISPMHGGLPSDTNAETMYGRAFSLGHFNQHMALTGRMSIGQREIEMSGYGWRDHSWGPRQWENIRFHRLLTAVFDNGEGFMLLKIANQADEVRRYGHVLYDRIYEAVEDFDLLTIWSEDKIPLSHTLRIRTATRKIDVSGEVISCAPLHNRRMENGVELKIQIAEGQTRWLCGGQTGYGMSEFGDRFENGNLAGYPL